jgi:hypothetical protein
VRGAVIPPVVDKDFARHDWIWPALGAEGELHRAARPALVAGTAVRGLLLRAKHLFDGAIVTHRSTAHGFLGQPAQSPPP